MVDNRDKSDHELMSEVALDSEPALKTLFDRYKKSLKNYISSFFADLGISINEMNMISGDILQETMINVWKYRLNYKPNYEFSTWIYTIAKRLTLNETKVVTRNKKRYIPQDDIKDDPISNDTTEIMDIKEKEILIKKCISNLKEYYSFVVMERIFEGRTYREISERTNISEGTLKSRFERALPLIKAELEKYGIKEI